MPPKAKYLIVSHAFPPMTGGIANIMESIAQALPPEDLMVLSPSKSNRKGYAHSEPDPSVVKQHDAAYPFPVQRITFSVQNKYKAFISMCWLNLWALWLALRCKSEYVYYSLSYPVGLLAPLFPLIGKKYIVHVYGSELFRKRTGLALLWQRYIYRKAYKVVAISHWTRKALIDFGVSPEKIEVVYPRVNPARFAEPKDLASFVKQEGLEGKRVLLTVAHLIHRKGQHLVLEALPELIRRHPDVLYVIVGVGPDETKLKGMAASYGIQEHVYFPGNRDQIAFFHACDIFVMPSLYITKPRGDIESFGIVYVEANLCKKPSVGANNGGMPEAIQAEKTGCLVETGSVEDLVGTLDRLLQNPEYAKKLGEQGYMRAVHELTQESLPNELQNKLFVLRQRA